MAVYTFDFHPYEDGPSYDGSGRIIQGGDHIKCDQPFTFGPYDVVTVIVEALYWDGELMDDERIPITSIIFIDSHGRRAAAYLPVEGSSGLQSLDGPSPRQAEIRLDDLFEPRSTAYGSIVQWAQPRESFYKPTFSLDNFLVTDIVAEGLLHDSMTADRYRMTIITPDGGASAFWTGFRGCREVGT